MRIVAVMGLSVGLWSCGTDREPPNPEDPDPRGYDALAYELVATFDWPSQRLTAHETITLDVSAGQNTAVLDAAVEIDQISTTAGAPLQFSYDRGTNQLKVELGPRATSDGRVAFTVDYHATVSGALITSDGRDDDPVTSRVVFTNSEPDFGVHWLVAHHHPSDRATWAVELTVAADEDVIANGARTRDDRIGATRVVRYELDQPIPTYLMAFAAGQLDHADRAGTPPLSVWYRRGLLIDTERNLDLLAELIGRFEPLIGPYPWPSYSVVLMPSPFGGGMENATITFNQESSGQGNLGLSLNAHELAHQWFGDWVTMNDYEDAWFKVGMATLLATEGDRARRGGGTSRKFGLDFAFNPDDSIVDRNLHSIARYTSGPYQRAAWMITQIRARIGDDAFWAALRKMLADNALGTLSGERFVRGFAPALGAAEIDQLIATLERKDTPVIGLSVAPSGADQQVVFSLHDPAHQLLVPLSVTVVDAAGAAVVHELRPDAPRTVVVPASGYVAPDEDELSPPWTVSFAADPEIYNGPLSRLFAPSAPAALAAFAERSASHQERATSDWGVPPMAAENFPPLRAGLDSTVARRNLETALCGLINLLRPNGDVAPWVAQVPALALMPGIETLNTRYGSCGVVPPSIAAELAGLIDVVTPATAARLAFLMSFDYGPEASLAQIGKVATSAPSLQLREQALNRLAAHARQASGYSPITDPAPWKALFQDQLSRAESAGRFNLAWGAALNLADRDALPIAGHRLHDLTPSLQRQVVCNAYLLTSGDADWEAFRTAALPWETLPAAVQAVVREPSGCQAAMLRARPEPVLAKPN
jgi:hypothetical protein